MMLWKKPVNVRKRCTDSRGAIRPATADTTQTSSRPSALRIQVATSAASSIATARICDMWSSTHCEKGGFSRSADASSIDANSSSCRACSPRA